jgi:hypothetical protein
MTLAQSGRASYRWLFVTVIVLAGVYVWYAIAHYGRLNTFNQRQLSNAASVLEASFENAAETVAQFKAKRRTFELTRSASPADQENTARVCDFDRGQPYLDLRDCVSDATAVEQGQWHRFALVQPVATPALGIEVGGSTKGGTQDAPPIRPSEFFQFRPDVVLRELSFPDSFGLIFVATTSGEILFQDEPTRREAQLRSERPLREAQRTHSPMLRIRNLQEVVGGGPEAWNALRSISTRLRLRLGGITHQLYLQPVTIDTGTRHLELIVGGAVPTMIVVRESLAVDTHLYGVLMFVLLLAILGFPFVKLAFLDARERFRLRDITLLYLSTGALLVLFTCASLALDGHARWQAVADDGLAALARHLESRVLDEVVAIRDQMHDYDRTFASMATADCDKWAIHTRWFAGQDSDRLPAADRHTLPLPSRHVHLRQIAWIRGDGLQVWKATADAIQGRTRVDRRPYFRAVRDDTLFSIRGSTPAVFLGPDRSISDGKFYTFFSMPSTLPPNACGQASGAGTPVVATTAQLLSLDRQALPAGYGFAVIADDGSVLYHSDRRRSLRENLFDELSHGSLARGMIAAGRAGYLESRYSERPYEFYFHPLAITPIGEPGRAAFSVAVFRDTSLEQILIGHVFVAGLIGPMVLLLCVYGAGLGAVALASRHTDRHWSTWLWPHSGLEHIYRRQSLAFALLLIGSAVFYTTVSSIGAFLVMPLLAAAAGIAIYVHGRRQSGPRHPLARWSWQTSALLLVLVCMVIAPTVALFRLTLGHEFAKLILSERESIEGEQRDVLRAAEAEAVEEQYARSLSGPRMAARRTYVTCLPAPFDARQPDAGSIEPRARGEVLRTSLTAAQPAPSRETPEVATALPNRCAPASADDAPAVLQPIALDMRLLETLHWPGEWLPIENRLARQHFLQRDAAYSPNGTIVPMVRASGVVFLGFAITVALLLWWIRWNTNRLFFANAAVSDSIPPPENFEEWWKARTNDERMVLLQVTRERIANPYQRTMIAHLLEKGWLTLDPILQPASAELRTFLLAKEKELHADMQQWEEVNVGHSWRYVRLILLAGVIGLGCFLIATQPGLQSTLLGIATALTGALATGLKLKDALVPWFEARKNRA